MASVVFKKTITHDEICGMTSTKLGKGYTPESVSTVITQYGDSMNELILANKPGVNEVLMVQTPYLAMKIQGQENGKVIVNTDGSKSHISGGMDISTAISKDLMDLLHKAVTILSTTPKGGTATGTHKVA